MLSARHSGLLNMHQQQGSVRRMVVFVINGVSHAGRLARQFLTCRRARWMAETRMRWTAWNPRTFNERLRYKMAYDRRPLLTMFADKVTVKAYVDSVLGEGFTARTFVDVQDPRAIDWSALPSQFVVKVNHGSGGTIIVSDEADANSHLPSQETDVGWRVFRVRPEHADPILIESLCRRWLRMDYSWRLGEAIVEWCYADIPRRVLVEELLTDAGGQPPREYRFFVIGGRVAFLQVEIDTGGDHRTAVMTPDWAMLPVRFRDPPPTVAPERPRLLDDMIAMAEILGKAAIDFVRVDMYDLGSRAVVGEMTNYPNRGSSPISSGYYAELWGRGWRQEYGPRHRMRSLFRRPMGDQGETDA